MNTNNELSFYRLLMVVMEEHTNEVKIETYTNLSLSDYEVIYGNETREIQATILTKQETWEG